MNIDPLKYWKDGAFDALDTAEKLFEAKKYHFSLFFLHLALEKAVKAIYVKKKDAAAPIGHDLVLLAEKSNVRTTDKVKADLAEISTFNIAARYDDYKLEFYKRASKEYTKNWIKKAKYLFKYFFSLLS